MWLTRVAVFLTFLTVVFGFFTAMAGMRRQNRSLDDIHILVNSNYKAINDRVEQLIAILHEHQIDVPPPPKAPAELAPPK